MASLPSFVQLMAALGLSDPHPSSPDPLPKSPRSRSRYAPYSPSVVCAALHTRFHQLTLLLVVPQQKGQLLFHLIPLRRRILTK